MLAAIGRTRQTSPLTVLPLPNRGTSARDSDAAIRTYGERNL